MFTIKQNDTSPAIQAALKTPNKQPVNLIGASVIFNMKDETGRVLVSNTAVVVDDERLARVKLILLLAKYDTIEIVGEAEDVSSAITIFLYEARTIGTGIKFVSIYIFTNSFLSCSSSK